MDLSAIERILRDDPSVGVLLVDPRLLRRVIKRHTNLPGLGLQVPHAQSYVLPRDAWLALAPPEALGQAAATLPADILLLARPAPDEILGKAPALVLAQLWRAAFHARIHLEIGRLIARGQLTDAAIRGRIDRIGQTEFDEVRAVLRHDDLVLPPYGDRETYAEFAALFLELRTFAPALLPRIFPSLGDLDRAEATITADVSARPLLDRCRPEGAAPIAMVARQPRDSTTTPTFLPAPTLGILNALSPRDVSKADVGLLNAQADVERARGNHVGAALLRIGALTATVGTDQELKTRMAVRSDLDALADRLGAALRPIADPELDRTSAAWTSLLVMLAEEAGPRRGLRYPVEARLLYDLQKAAVVSEREIYAVDVATYALSLGKRPVIRSLPATREVRIARYIKRAAAKLRHVRIAAADRRLLARLLRWAKDRAEENVRAALRPKIIAVFAEVGLRPSSNPEQIARNKLVEELLDQIVLREFLSIGHLRDALSRNQLKMGDLVSPRELLEGDSLLEADRRLGLELDGVYRRGEVYLRGLQKTSSIAFGTKTGRQIVLYLALPLISAYVILEGVQHMIDALGVDGVHLLTPPSFVITVLVVFGLLHSHPMRAAAIRGAKITGHALAAVFFHFPRWVLTRPAVKRALHSRAVRGAARYLLTPLAATALIYRLTPLHLLDPVLGLGGAAVIFAATNILINSRKAILLEEVALDWLVNKWRTLSRRVLPGLFRFIASTFKAMIEVLERAIYKVDEWLRYHRGEHVVTLGAKAVLGLAWFIVAYIIRLYITLLVEPEVNPLKHFPVVTVAHKIMLPFSAALLHAFQTALSPFGPVVANAIAGPTVFLFPSVFGFLVWELKANWQLYGANRAKSLRPTLIGSHGETMGTLMKPGFHSGTLPKLFARLRRAAREADQEITAPAPDSKRRSAPPQPRAETSLRSYQDDIHEVEEAVRRFIERELIALLVDSPRWPSGAIQVRRIELGSNRVRVELGCPVVSSESCEIAFEEQSGFLVASIPRAGFLDALPAGEGSRASHGPGGAGETDAPRGGPRLLIENALAGLYQFAGVDLVREQLEAALAAAFGAAPPYDISDEGLVVWPGNGYRTEVIYDIDADADGTRIEPKVRGEAPIGPPPPLDKRRILFRLQSIAWSDWMLAWSTGFTRDAAIPRVLKEASILPPRFGRPGAAGGGRSAA